MDQGELTRKSLTSEEFVGLRAATEKIHGYLTKKLAAHLEVLRPLFVPRKLLGTYIKSAVMEEEPVSDRAFASLQERYAAVCSKPFGLPKKLQTPLPALSTTLDGTPFQYPLGLSGGGDKTISVTSSAKWVLSYRGECSLTRLKAMVSGAEVPQPEEMRQAIINHLAVVVYLEHFPSLTAILEDLRYLVEIRTLPELGGLPVVLLSAPVQTFLPPDDFILQITQLSGIAAFQEIIDNGAIQNMPDPLKSTLLNLAANP